MQKKIKIKIITESIDCIPTYATLDAAAADLKANISEDIILLSGEAKLIPTGIFLEIPNGFEVQIRPRSGLALKNSVTVLNTPGTIDSDYRGEIKVILINHSKSNFIIEPKMRIGQMVIAPTYQAEFIKTTKLSTSIRGEEGFGHTGTH